jgi:uncharacterized protein
MFRLIPREEKFFEMFEEMAKNAHEGAKLLKQLLTSDGVDEADIAQSVKSLEHRGDLMVHSLVVKLNKTFLVPIDREDIYLLATSIDSVLDLIESVARRKVMFKVRHMGEASVQISHILQRATAEIVAAVSLIKDAPRVMEHCIEINRLEEESDHIYHEALAKLFQEEKDPIELIKRKELFECLETALDECEDVANVIESIVVKNA